MAIFDLTSGAFYGSVSAAIQGSAAGDVIQLSPGTYSEDFPKIRHDLTIEGVGGMATLTPLLTVNPQAGDPLYQPPSNGQGVLVIDGGVRLDHLEITGAAVPDQNGAGVRYETGSLTITNSHIHGNQDGLLANGNPGANILIDHSEFDHNGAEDGFSHNIYVNEVGRFSLTNSYIHDALGGHEVKSRADQTIITGSRIDDGTADTSYSVDLPNGGVATLSGNDITKGLNAPNWFIVHFGGEGTPTPGDPLLTTAYPGSSLTITGNVFTSDLPDCCGIEHRLLLDQAGDPLSSILLPVISGNVFNDIPADQLVTGSLGGSLAYFPAALYSEQNVFNTSEPPASGLVMLALALGLLARRAASGCRAAPGVQSAAPCRAQAATGLRIGGMMSVGRGQT